MARWLNGSMTQFYGVLAGDDDKQIGTFSGIAGKEKLGGTYTFENGDSGIWSWSGGIVHLRLPWRARGAHRDHRVIA